MKLSGTPMSASPFGRPMSALICATAESVVANDKMDRLRRAMGLGTDGAVDRFIAQINADIGLPKGLADMGVPESFIDEAIGKAMKDHCHATNPRIATPDEYRRMLRESW